MGLVGLALSLTMLSTAFSQGFGGELSDLWGSKRVMELALALRSLTAAGMGLAMGLGPTWLLVGLGVLSSFLGAFFEPAIRSWVAEEYPAHQRASAYGSLRVAMNLGWAVGPALGGLLAERSYPLMFAGTAVVCALCLGALRWGLEDDGPAREAPFSLRGVMSAAGDARLLEFCACGLLLAVVMSQLVVSLSVHSVRFAALSEREVGLLFGLNGLVVILTQRWITGLMRRLRLSLVLACGSLLYALGYGWVGWARGFPLMASAVVVVSLGEVVAAPGLQALAVNLAPARLKGRYLGFQGLTSQAGSALGPLLGGLALQHLSPRWPGAPWLLVAATGAVAGLGFYRLGRRLSPQEEGL